MKKIFTILLVISLLFSGCSNTSTQDPHKQNTSEEKKIKIFYPRRDQIPEDYYVSDWKDYIDKKYGYDVELEYIRLKTDGNFWNKGRIDIQEFIKNHETDGLVYITDFEILNQLKEAHLLLPVDSYIDGLRWLGNPTPGTLDAFSDSSGNMWAVPLTDNILSGFRIFDKDMLDAAGVEVPQTIEELFEYAKVAAREDFDGNGVNDTYLFEFILNGRFHLFEGSEYVISSFDDIFRAFGCYGSPGEPIQYNPYSNKFENFVNKENFIEAMTFIKLLFDENLIIEWSRIENEYNTASMYSMQSTGTYRNNAYSFYISGPNEKYLIREKYQCLGMAVLTNTRNPEEKLSNFLDLAVGNPDGYVDLIYGFEDKFYEDRITYYSLLGDYMDTLNRTDIDLYVNIGGINEIKPVYPGDNYTVTDKIRAIYGEDNRIKEELAEKFGSSLSYYVPFDRIRIEVEELNASLYSDTATLFRNILYGDADISAAVDDYITTTNSRLGWIDTLALINGN
jgi:ABC-type glycerol-3-phosphate transport system substrate-binding protein